MTPVQQEPCVDCGSDWSMTKDEVAFWERLGREKGWVWPKRCPDCRARKKEMKNAAFSSEGIPQRLIQIADAIQFGEFNEKNISSELRALAGQLKGFFKKGGKGNHDSQKEKAEAVEESS